jgi:hypothetical protein
MVTGFPKAAVRRGPQESSGDGADAKPSEAYEGQYCHQYERDHPGRAHHPMGQPARVFSATAHAAAPSFEHSACPLDATRARQWFMTCPLSLARRN